MPAPHRDRQLPVEPRLIGTDRVHDASMRQFVDEPLLRRAHDRAVDFLRALPQRPVGARASRQDLLAALSVPLSDEGQDAAQVIDALSRGADGGITGSAGPRYFGFVIGGSLPRAPGARLCARGPGAQHTGLSRVL